MSIRTAVPAILSCALFATGIGCTSQPTSPSSLGSIQAAGTESATSRAGGSQSRSASPSRFGSRMPGTVYVTSQGLYYDTFVVRDPLPMQGRFQLLTDGTTEVGPGQPGYLGGRWWVDVNANGVQDPDDAYLLCPLLPPGRLTP
jgi:hypothetical protein